MELIKYISFHLLPFRAKWKIDTAWTITVMRVVLEAGNPTIGHFGPI